MTIERCDLEDCFLGDTHESVPALSSLPLVLSLENCQHLPLKPLVLLLSLEGRGNSELYSPLSLTEGEELIREDWGEDLGCMAPGTWGTWFSETNVLLLRSFKSQGPIISVMRSVQYQRAPPCFPSDAASF